MAELGVYGNQNQATGISDYNATAFLVQQMLNRMNIATLVRVVACSNNGGLTAVGTVDVLPLVNLLDGLNRAIPHTTIYGLPYFRIQGGVNGIILDPQPGDIGICIFADRDISAVKDSKQQANPGSKRRNDWSDGMYVGGVLNGVPMQYVQFATGGIKIHSPGTVTIEGSAVVINGPVTSNGGITTPDDIVAGTISLKTHRTSGVTAGGGISNIPVP